MTPLLNELIEAFCLLPGVGPKTAQRMVLHLLEHNRPGGKSIAELLSRALVEVGHCQFCRNLSEQQHCDICSNKARDESVLCIVETPSDVSAIEQTASFRGRYFVLMGRLSPLDGIGPQQIGIDKLTQHFEQGKITEIIIATSSTIEGQVTAQYIADLAKKRAVKATRIAHGVPLGGELEYVDGHTLAQALNHRVELS